jgi:dTDP-4-dehydrorhamnose 3,5-epimerase-like enzyme
MKKKNPRASECFQSVEEPASAYESPTSTGAPSRRPFWRPLMTVTMERVDLGHDDRGFLFHPVAGDVLSEQREAHAVITRPGAIRGNHCHRTAEEILAVAGPARVRYREDGTVHEVEIPENAAYRFRFPAGVSHAVQHTGEGPGFLVAFSTNPFNPDDPDGIRDELIVSEGG